MTTGDESGTKSKEAPSVWIFTFLALGASMTPLINRVLNDPISGKMNAMLFVAGVAFPASSVLYLFGSPSLRDKLAVLATFVFGALTLMWVDGGRLDGRVFVIATLFLVPSLVRVFARRA